MPVILSIGEEAIGLTARVDTGFTFCVSTRLRRSARNRYRKRSARAFGTVTGGFNAFGHALTLNTLGYSLNVMSLRNSLSPETFSAARGWLDQVRLGLVEYEGKLYLAGYDPTATVLK